MTKKPTAAKTVEAPHVELTNIEDSFLRDAGILPQYIAYTVAQRLFLARKEIHNADLTSKFKIHRDFEAFSIHKLAEEIEKIVGKYGVVIEFDVEAWHKNGNSTILEGHIVFSCVMNRNDRVFVKTIGEGVDNGDKGVGKALSYARKMGLIQEFNLVVGIDNEASDEKAKPEQATSGSKPQPDSGKGPPVREDGFFRVINLNGVNDYIDPDAFASCFIGIVKTLPEPGAIKWFAEQNEPSIQSYEKIDATGAAAIRLSYDQRHRELTGGDAR